MLALYGIQHWPQKFTSSFYGSLINSLTYDSPLRDDRGLHVQVVNGPIDGPQTISSKVLATGGLDPKISTFRMWCSGSKREGISPSLPRKTPNKVNSGDREKPFVHDTISKTLSCASLLHLLWDFPIGRWTLWYPEKAW